jgi:hypothetical protein
LAQFNAFAPHRSHRPMLHRHPKLPKTETPLEEIILHTTSHPDALDKYGVGS